MRPVDLLILGMLFGVMGRTEQIRDGRKTFSATTCNFIGMFLAVAGWTWLLQSWGWYS